jgi:hypothetical protein
MTPLALRCALLLSRYHWQRWEACSANPRATQNELLLRIIRQNRSSAFGRDHGFGAIETIEEYRKQVPVGDYERFRPYIDRAKQGESAVLTGEPVLMFTMTSGSTGEPKLIPVTESTRVNHSRQTRLWYSRAFQDHPGSAAGKVFGLVGRTVEGHTTGAIPYGAASGLIYQSSPAWIKRAHALPYEIAEIKDFQAKYYVAMRLAIEQDVTFLGTPNPSTILRLVETADRFRDEIVKDVRDGSLSNRFELAPDIRAALSKKLSPNRGRAQKLAKALAAAGQLRPSDYWPNLRLIGCWKGGSVGVRLKELAAWFGDAVPTRDLGYMASEAQMSLPISDHGSAGILAIDANFYEFIPESENGKANPITLDCDELEVSKVYSVILTTAAGLYRYDINDLIRVTGFHGRTPLIEFLRKGRDVTNITGEKLHVNQVIQAMEQAQRATGADVQHFRGFADVEKSRYVFMVELDGTKPNDETLKHLLTELDTRLSGLNIEYADKRKSDRLKAPVLCLMKPGWFERKASAALQAGARDVQFKVQLLSATPEDPGEIICTVETSNSMAISNRRN